MKKILLVEDTLLLAEEIVDILRMENYAVSTATNGDSALAVLSHSRPDLIITDLLMPGMDGFEFIKRLRSMLDFASIPIIVLSARTSEADKALGKELGANDFVPKPCKSHELLAAVEGLLKS